MLWRFTTGSLPAVAVYQLGRNRDYIKMVSFRNDDIQV